MLRYASQRDCDCDCEVGAGDEDNCFVVFVADWRDIHAARLNIGADGTPERRTCGVVEVVCATRILLQSGRGWAVGRDAPGPETLFRDSLRTAQVPLHSSSQARLNRAGQTRDIRCKESVLLLQAQQPGQLP
jgi:hypothetical protein